VICTVTSSLSSLPLKWKIKSVGDNNNGGDHNSYDKNGDAC
jgi:hypothetical protein